MSTINERIKVLLNALNHSGNSFAKALEINPSVVNSITGPRQTKPGAEILEKIVLTFPRVNSEWLITGKGEPLRQFSTGNDTVSEQQEVSGSYNNVASGSGNHKQKIKLGHNECLEKLQIIEQRLNDKEQLLQAKEEVIDLLRKQLEMNNR